MTDSDPLVLVDSYKLGDRLGQLPPLGDPDLGATEEAIRQWLALLLQAEHLSVLIGSGLSIGLALEAGVSPVSMGAPPIDWIPSDAPVTKRIRDHAAASATVLRRGAPNVEDYLRAALELALGLKVMADPREAELRVSIQAVLKALATAIADSEQGLADAMSTARGRAAWELAMQFLLAFAHRAASRDRLHLFTTNYDRILEFACDLAGLRVVDRFVGTIRPVFRSTRVDVDFHYNPPGIRGEPRYLEGVVRFAKVHGSLDWTYRNGEVIREPLGFGAAVDVPDPSSLIIFPNPAKDIETTEFPYAELFRDFSAAVCRPNAATVTFGYGFGDSHVNRVLADVLTVPGSSLMILSHGDPDGRIASFVSQHGGPDHLSYLVGPRLAGLGSIVTYLPRLGVQILAGASSIPVVSTPLEGDA